MKRSWRISAVRLVLIATLIAFVRAEAAPTTFRFSPKVGSQFTETIERERVEERNFPVPIRNARRSVVVNDWSIRSKSGNYVYICATKSVLEEVNGKPSLNPVTKVYEGLEQTHVISRDGHWLRTTLNKDLVLEVKRRFPTNFNPFVEQDFSTEAFAEAERNMRSELVLPLVGRTIDRGTVWTRDTTDTKAGFRPDIQRYMLYVFPDIVQHRKKDTTVKFLYFMCTDKKMFDQYQLTQAPDINSPVVTQFLESIRAGEAVEKVCVKRLVNAETMTIISEDFIRQKVLQRSDGVWVSSETIRKRYDERD